MQGAPIAEIRQLLEVYSNSVVSQRSVAEQHALQNWADVTWNGCQDHSGFRIPQSVSITSATGSTG